METKAFFFGVQCLDENRENFVANNKVDEDELAVCAAYKATASYNRAVEKREKTQRVIAALGSAARTLNGDNSSASRLPQNNSSTPSKAFTAALTLPRGRGNCPNMHRGMYYVSKNAGPNFVTCFYR
jgi:hypothetical protein